MGGDETVRPFSLRSTYACNPTASKIALPYALLLRAELSEDATNCLFCFATHEVSVRGRHLREVYLAVSQGQAAEISIGQSATLREGMAFLGPLVTDVRIEPTDESGRGRR